MNCDASFLGQVQLFGDSVAIVTEDGTQLTYREITRAADEFAQEMRGQRSLVAIEGENSLASLVAYLGAIRSGHVVLLVGQGSAEDAAVLSMRPNWVFRDGALNEVTNGAARALHPALALLLPTSGSTGSAKLVRLSYANIHSNAHAIASYLGITHEDAAITSLPLSYSYGLSVLHSHWACGARILLTDRSVIEPEFWRFFREKEGTSIAGVPFSYELFERTGLRCDPPPTLRTMTQAGGKLDPDMLRTYARFGAENGIRFYTMYGQTEAAPRMAYLPPELAADYPDCIGVPIPGGSFRLADEDGSVIDEADRTGELVYSGPNVMMGYAVEPADLARPAGCAELYTGDMAQRTPDGLYRIVGRASRFLKIAGLRIGLDDLDLALANAGFTAVAGGSDARLVLCVQQGEAERVRRWVVEHCRLPPDRVVAYQGEVPRLPSGKIDYPAIRARGDAATLKAARNDLVESSPIRAAYMRALGLSSVQPGSSFASLGGDSLSYVGLSVELEDLLGMLPPRWEERSIASLEQLMPAARRPRRFWNFRTIETEVVFRALAILAVVSIHASSSWPVGGGSDVLILLFGYNLSRHQRIRLIEGRLREFLSTFLVKIILPYYFLLLAYSAIRSKWDPASLLLVSNYFGRFRSLMEPYWFLEMLLQSMIVIAVVFALPPVRRLAQRNPWLLGIILLGISTAAAVAFTTLLPRPYLARRTPELLLWLAALGWCLHQAQTRAQRLGLATFVACVISLAWLQPGGTSLSYPLSLPQMTWLAAATLLILWLPRLPLPAGAHAAITTVAGASFYIYLAHMVPVHIFHVVLGWDNLPFILLMSVIAGIALRRVMEMGGHWPLYRSGRGAGLGLSFGSRRDG